LARISDRLVLQLVGDDLVLADDKGQEIRVEYEHVTRFLCACEYLRRHASVYDEEQVLAEFEQIRANEARVAEQLGRG